MALPQSATARGPSPATPQQLSSLANDFISLVSALTKDLNGAAVAAAPQIAAPIAVRAPAPVVAPVAAPKAPSPVFTSIYQRGSGRMLCPETGAMLASLPGAIGLDDLDTLIATHVGPLRIKLDPASAARMLDGNVSNSGHRTNRRISEVRVAEMLADMERGDWLLTGQTIIMSDAGILNTGQHRLTAILRHGAVIETDVVFGVARAAVVHTDTGKPQSSADVLYKHNVANAARVAAALRLIIAYRGGLPESLSGKTGTGAIMAAYGSYPDIDAAIAMVNSISNWPKRVVSGYLDALAYLVLVAGGQEKAHEFLTMVASGATTELSDPRRLLNDRLRNDATETRGMSPTEKLAIGIKAWNAYTTGTPINMARGAGLRWRGKGVNRESFPVVVGLEWSDDAA